MNTVYFSAFLVNKKKEILPTQHFFQFPAQFARVQVGVAGQTKQKTIRISLAVIVLVYLAHGIEINH